jgi:hypothetical protein
MTTTTKTTKTSPETQARALLANAKANNFKVQVRGDILTIVRQFEVNNLKQFADCDMSYYSVLGCLPRTKSGSDWGTDGGGIGALSAMRSGTFVMNRSGGSVRVLRAVEKILAESPE